MWVKGELVAENGGEPRVVQAQIEYPAYEALPVVYATNLIIQFTGEEFVLNFYGVYPPVQVDSLQAPPEKVPAHCVARVAISRGRMPSFATVFAAQVEATKNITAVPVDGTPAEEKKSAG